MDFDTFLSTIKKAGLSKEEFIELAGLNKNTLTGWATKRQGKKTQPWVDSWLQMYIENKKKDIIIEHLEGNTNETETNKIK